MENVEDNINSTTNISLIEIQKIQFEELMLKHLGQVRDPLYVVIPISIIYASIFITGTIGNISTCIVIARNKSMHTATNYYLFSLAISDLLLLICGMPVEIYQVWSKYPYVFGETFCILRGLAAETSTNASVLTITAFTAERYVAICHPFLSQTMSKLSRAVKLILFIWFVALVCAIPQALQFGIIHFTDRPEDVMCQFKKVIIKHSFEVSTFLFFVVPMTLIMVLYILIGLKLKKSTLMKRNCRREQHSSESSRVKVGTSRMDRHCRHSRSTRRVLKMLVAVVVAFFICWAPFHMQRLIAIYGNADNHSLENTNWIQTVYVIFTYVSGVLYYFSTTINPILYNIMSNKFREAFMETLARSCRMSRFMAPRERRSYSSLSRSHQRIPIGTGPTKTTCGSGGTGIAHVRTSESTDCSANSSRDGQQEVQEGINDYSTSEVPTIPRGWSSSIIPNSKQSSRNLNCAITVEVGTSDIDLPMTSAGNTINEQQELDVRLSELAKLNANELPSPDYDKNTNTMIQGSPTRSLCQQNVINRQQQQQQQQQRRKSSSTINNNKKIKDHSNSKKWWSLLDWLPGIKSLRNSRIINRTNLQDSNVSSDQNHSIKQQDDHFMQLHTFKSKDESFKNVG